MSARAVEPFTAELAARTPAPGAGAAAGVAASLAAALVGMAASFSDDAASAAAGTRLRDEALRLAEEDGAAYAAVLGARGDERRAALSRAADVPLRLAELASELDGLARLLAERGNPNLRGEALAAGELARAATRAAANLVTIDLHGRPDARADAARRLAAGTAEPAAPAVEETWKLTRTTTVAQGTVAWDRLGEGPPLVLVHGTPSWSYLWRTVAPVLAERFTVHVYDLVGYGSSLPAERADVSIAAHARTLCELLDVWGLEQPAVAGHDIGGAVVLRAHLLHGRAFRAIGLVDAVALAPWITPTTRHIQAHLETYATMPGQIFARIVEAHLRTAVAGAFEPAALAAYLAPWQGPEGRAAYLRKVERLDEEDTRELEPLLGQIDVPAGIVWGADDAWLDASLAPALAARIPGARVRLVEGAGHFATEDAPAAVTRALLDLLASERPSSRGTASARRRA